MQPYERLLVWQEAHRLTLAVYEITSNYPANERYGLTSQIRRAAFSVAANIVEGSAKRGSREFRRYLDIAIGSLAELGYALKLSRDLGLLDDAAWTRLDDQRQRTSFLLWQLYKAIRPREP